MTFLFILSVLGGFLFTESAYCSLGIAVDNTSYDFGSMTYGGTEETAPSWLGIKNTSGTGEGKYYQTLYIQVAGATSPWQAGASSGVNQFQMESYFDGGWHTLGSGQIMLKEYLPHGSEYNDMKTGFRFTAPAEGSEGGEKQISVGLVCCPVEGYLYNVVADIFYLN